MRLLFGAPRKTGNAYLRCLLASAYALQVVGLRDGPQASDGDNLTTWLDQMPRDSVAGTSLACSPRLRAIAAEQSITLISVIRHPFDLFLSNFEVAQQKATRDKNKAGDEPLIQAMAGLSLDDPAVHQYAGDGFAAEIAWLRDWHDGASSTIRYEQLLSAPADILDALSLTIGPLAPAAITHALDLCQAENLVVCRPARGRRMPAVPPGAWRELLPAALLSVLHERYADDVAYLGYDRV